MAAIPLAKISGVLILIALFFSFGNIRWRLPREVFVLTLLVAQLWLAAVFSPIWKGGAVNVMLDFSKVLPLVIVIYAAARSIGRLRLLLFVQASSCAVIALTSVLNRHTLLGRLEGALSGIYGNPNDLALIIDLSLPLCLALALTTRSHWIKLAWAVAMLAMIYAVLLTASRSGAIALLVVAVVCLWYLGIKSRRYYLVLLIPIAVIAIWFVGGMALLDRFGQTGIDPLTNGHTSAASASALQRKELLFQSLRVTVQHPLLGVGPGNFTVSSGIWAVTHNSYTQISAEGGLPAFILYLLIFSQGLVNLTYIKSYTKAEKETQLFVVALQASLAAYLVGSFFASMAYQLFPYFLVAYSSSLRQIVKKKNQTGTSFVANAPTTTQVEAPLLWH